METRLLAANSLQLPNRIELDRSVQEEVVVETTDNLKTPGSQDHRPRILYLLVLL
jgi:hypothetical protein